jgi:helicase
MRRIDAGVIGTVIQPILPQWQELRLEVHWRKILDALTVGNTPRRVQFDALVRHQVLEHRKNIIVSAPTNSGKTLLGLLVLIDAVKRGRRAVLLEPLRALARERFDELQIVAPRLSAAIGFPLRVSISTGDYRIETEIFSSAPPDHGEIVIATPERFEAITRNPEYNQWLESIDEVCVDEAHLIGSCIRGATLEYLLTTLLCLPAPPRLTLLSATLGNTDRVREWLSPCDLIAVDDRYPRLHQEVLELALDEDANEVVCRLVLEVLQTDPSAAFLVFVYQTASAERLVHQLRGLLPEAADSQAVLAYHSQMNATQRELVRQAMCERNCRCVVTTTALGLGVNLPASHVIVRDNTFFGFGPLSVADLMQMMGRAGRGEQPGSATVIVRPSDAWNADELASALREQRLPDFISSFDNRTIRQDSHRAPNTSAIVTIATHVAAQLSRQPERGLSIGELENFFERSLGGKTLAKMVSVSCAWLEDAIRSLAFVDEFNRYRLTRLGLCATRAIFPLDYAAGFGQLIRDFLTIDSYDEFLTKWRPLDHLALLEMLSSNVLHLRPFSVRLADQVDSWMEAAPDQVPMLYRDWIAGNGSQSRAIEVFGSLGITAPNKNGDAEWAGRAAYLAIFRAIILFERASGVAAEDVARRWEVKNLTGVEERWRDNLLWLLSGLAKILDLHCFYYHLIENCSASSERIQRVKRLLNRMRQQTFEVREQLKHCSPLGSVLQSLRRTRFADAKPVVGTKSIKRLEEAGIVNFSELAQLKMVDLVRLGVRPDLARQIRSYVRRRLV